MIRRCARLMLELDDGHHFDLADLAAGGDGVATRPHWLALAPHLDHPVELSLPELAAMASVSSRGEWTKAQLADLMGPAVLAALLAKRLLLDDSLAEHADALVREQAFRETGWWTPAAVLHRHGRWCEVDVETSDEMRGAVDLSKFVATRGAPPPHVAETAGIAPPVTLPTTAETPLDSLLQSRSTCRNFDATATLSRVEVASVLQRSLGATASKRFDFGFAAIKRNSPSGGGLHPIEGRVLVQRVEGLAPGLYHYHSLDHTLVPLRWLEQDEASALARRLVAGQSWFASAPVLVLLTARFERNFWKYRNHAKAYRVIQLDAGHLSQVLLLAATDAGLGAFITGAINDDVAESAFGLDGVTEGAIAVCGFGKRSGRRDHVEFDPNGRAVV